MGLNKIARVALVCPFMLLSLAALAWRGEGVETVPWEQQASAEGYFDSLASGANATTAMRKLRSIEGFAGAQRTYKLARGPLRAWLLKAAPPNDDALIIVVDGQQTVYRTLGHLTPTMVETLLANMSVAAVP